MPVRTHRHLRAFASVIAAASVALAVTACGGDVRGNASASTPPPTATAPTADAPTAPTTSTTTPAPSKAHEETAPAAPATPTGGRTDGDVTAVTVTVQGYAAAFASADGVSGCALLTPQSRQQFVDQVRAEVGDVTCDQAFTEAAQGTPDDVRKAFGQATVDDVAVTGATAEATISVSGRTNRITLAKIDGEWRIASAPGQ